MLTAQHPLKQGKILQMLDVIGKNLFNDDSIWANLGKCHLLLFGNSS